MLGDVTGPGWVGPLRRPLFQCRGQLLGVKKNLKNIGILVVLFVTVLFVKIQHTINTTAFKLTLDDVVFSDYPPLQPGVYSDFPTVSRSEPLIPHIIHQTHKTSNIPSDYIPYVQSFVTHNPNWTYILWTDESARKFISERHPYLLKLWDNYKKNINRADALRYVVLYEFGGVYVDMDFENFRPLDRVTYKYACIFPPEPFEHAVFRLRIPYLISNAIMMCRPKHPFLKQLLENLQYYYHMLEQIDTAGPAFITSQFMIYNNITGNNAYAEDANKAGNSPYFYKGQLPEDDINAVYVPNTRYFMDTLDSHMPSKPEYDKLCSDLTKQNMLTRRMCVEYIQRGFKRNPNKFTYTEHHWFQSYFKKNWLKHKISIFDIVPHCKIYGHVPFDGVSK